MEFKQFYAKGLSQLSYVLQGDNGLIIVDPARDITPYLEVSKNTGLPIQAVLETHLHADFVSGHLELAHQTGARIYISKQAHVEYNHEGLEDGEEVKVGSFRIKMLDTPGHTPDCSVFLVSDLELGDTPIMLFTGDTLLIGDVGRPDLFPKIKDQLADSLYNSLKRLKVLGDYMELYPAHGAGSLCGKKLSAKLTSTLGIEKIFNEAFNMVPKEHFIEHLLDGMPAAPDHFSRCSEINRIGPCLLSETAPIKAFDTYEFNELVQEGYVVIDTRDQLPHCGAHIPGAYGLSLQGNFATFSGWVIPPEKSLLIVADDMESIDQAVRGLQSVGLDNIKGYLRGGMDAWAASGYKTESIDTISVTELYDMLEEDRVLLVDTRLLSEYEEGHIPGAIHIAAPDVRSAYTELNKSEKPIAFVCNTGNRSLLAASLMKKFGSVDQMYNVIGGTKAWISLGYDLEH